MDTLLEEASDQLNVSEDAEGIVSDCLVTVGRDAGKVGRRIAGKKFEASRTASATLLAAVQNYSVTVE